VERDEQYSIDRSLDDYSFGRHSLAQGEAVLEILLSKYLMCGFFSGMFFVHGEHEAAHEEGTAS